jgi:TctA family transporter
LLGLVGNDAATGLARFDFGIAAWSDGLGFVAMALGVLCNGRIISNLAHHRPARRVSQATLQPVLLPGIQDLKDAAPQVLRGTAQATLVPMMSLGLPLNAVTALMLGAMALHQIQPGPQLVVDNPGLFWGLLLSLGVGHLMLWALNLGLSLPLIRIWARLFVLPYRWVAVVMVLLSAVGIYSLRHSALDVWLVAGLSAVGYLFNQLDLDPVPLLLGFILGPRMEDTLRQVLASSQGDWSLFVARPLSAGLLLLAVLMVLLVLLPAVHDRRSTTLTQY